MTRTAVAALRAVLSLKKSGQDTNGIAEKLSGNGSLK